MTQALNLGLLGNNVNTSGQLSLTAGVTGTLPIANGGTGATTAAAALSALGGIGSASPTITTPTIATIKSASADPTTFQNSSNVEIGRLCRAFVQYTGTTGNIIGSYNVSSVTYNSTGYWTVNFTNAMPDSNYVVCASPSTTAAGSGGQSMHPFTTYSGSPAYSAGSTTSFPLSCGLAGVGPVNPTGVFVSVFR